MGEEPDRIRAEIEATREQMSETVDAIGYKADVPARAKESINEKKESAKETLVGAKDSITSAITGAKDRVSDATPDSGDVRVKGQQVKQQGRRAVGLAQENPLGLAIGSVAVGFLAGLLVPSTRVEDEKIGGVADQVKEQVKETGQEALERGKSVAQEAVQSAQETVKERGQQEGQELASSAQQNAQQAASSARGSV